MYLEKQQKKTFNLISNNKNNNTKKKDTANTVRNQICLDICASEMYNLKAVNPRVRNYHFY